MQKHVFESVIDASAEKVWNILWGKESYPKWTSVFAEGSGVETDWQEGSKALFTDGKGEGMVATIEKNIPNEYMSIKHLGVYKDGVEDTESEKVKEWAGAHENYTLKEMDGQTQLTVDMDIEEKYEPYFLKVWPEALEKVKALAEER